MLVSQGVVPLGFLYLDVHTYRPATNDYQLTITYQGRDHYYRVKQYHTEIGATYWHLFANGRILDLKFSKGQLTEELISGQDPAPDDFLQLIEQELIGITGR